MSIDPSTWTERQVAKWLEENQFGIYSNDFVSNNINGAVLLEITYEELKDVGVIKIGDRSRILQAIRRQFRPNSASSTNYSNSNSSLNGRFKTHSRQSSQPLSRSDYAPQDNPSPDFNSFLPLLNALDNLGFTESSIESPPTSARPLGIKSKNSLERLNSAESLRQSRAPSYNNITNNYNNNIPFSNSFPTSASPLAISSEDLSFEILSPSFGKPYKRQGQSSASPLSPNISIKPNNEPRKHPVVTPISIAPRSSSIKADTPLTSGPKSGRQTSPISPASPISQLISLGFINEDTRKKYKETIEEENQHNNKQRFLKVNGMHDQTHSILIEPLMTVKTVRDKIFEAFRILSNYEQYVLLLNSSATGDMVRIDDDELTKIIKTPEKYVLTLRKQYIIPNVKKDSLKVITQLDSIKPRQTNETSPKPEQIENVIIKSDNSIISDPTHKTERRGAIGSFFGERPPDEIIAEQLETFFPDIKSKQSSENETDGIKSFVRTTMYRKRQTRNSLLLTQDPLYSRAKRATLIENQFNSKNETSWTDKSEVHSNIDSIPESPNTMEAKATLGIDDEFTTQIEKVALRMSILLTKKLSLPPILRWTQGKLIGQGAFGRVFHGLNLDTGEIMAVKQVLLGKENDVQRKKREEALQREMELLKELEHVNIVKYLEYVSGGSIASILKKYGKFEDNIARSMISQILLGLEYLHDMTIIHRDIKGANILVDSEGVPMISDFGISKKNQYQAAYQRVTRMSLQGSINWMAPEVAKEKGYSAKVDIWSLGCLVLEMLTGEKPWTGVKGNIMLHLANGKAPPISKTGLSEEACHFLDICLASDPDDRPTAAGLLNDPFAVAPLPFSFKEWFENAVIRKANEAVSDDEDDSDESEETGDESD